MPELTVTDLELIAAQVVKIALVCLMLFFAVLGILKAMRPGPPGDRLLRGTLAVVLIGLTVPIIQWIRVEASLLNSDLYTVGETVGFCQVTARGKGVEFRYMVKGEVYKGCISPHPIPFEDLKVPGGYYHVRYSEKFPGKGRMSFDRPMN